MTKKNLKLIMELIFIFILPLVILCINCNYQNTIEYDNNGNYQSTEKHIEFTTPFTFTDGYKNVINNFNLWNENWELGELNSNGTDYTTNNSIRSKYDEPIEILPSTQYYLKIPNVQRICWYDVNDTFISVEYSAGLKTSPSNAHYVRFSCLSSYGTTYNNDICINLSVTWANGNYVPYGEPLIIYSQTDISGQNDIYYTVWGKLKNLIIDNLQIQDNQIIDIIITYTILWFIHFVIWHFFYLFFDGLVHLFIDWGQKEKEKVK